MNALMQDVRYALRMMWRSPGFTIAAVLMLAIGLGANAAIFSVINAVLLKPLPYGQPERAVVIARAVPPGSDATTPVYPWGGFEVKLFEKIPDTFTAIGAFRSDFFNLANTERAERIDGARVTVGFFQAVGRQPFLGRSFTAEEDRPGHEQVVVLGYDLWQRVFGGDTGIVGRTITLNGASYTVVGVMPKGFSFPNGAEMPPNFEIPARTEIWTPLALPEDPHGPAYLLVVARMKPGLSVTQARAAMALAATRARKTISAGQRLVQQRDRAAAGSKWLARRARRSGFSGARSESCCSSPVPISRACCWSAALEDAGSFRCGWPWARNEILYCGN